MDVLENSTIKLRLEEDKHAHSEKYPKNEGNKIKTINDLENKNDLVCKTKIKLNPNKAGLFEGSFFWGVNFTPHSYLKKNLSNINTTLIQLLNNLFKVC